MPEPSLNEYFNLTNDLLFKLIISSLPHSMNKNVGSTMVFTIDSETLNSEYSIGVGVQVGDFMVLGVQTVTAWRLSGRKRWSANYLPLNPLTSRKSKKHSRSWPFRLS